MARYEHSRREPNFTEPFHGLSATSPFAASNTPDTFNLFQRNDTKQMPETKNSRTKEITPLETAKTTDKEEPKRRHSARPTGVEDSSVI